MSYPRSTYQLRRYEVVAPKVDNSGELSGYPEAMRRRLQSAGFTGWTEFETAGYWYGKREEGVTFVIYSEETRRPFANVGSLPTEDILGELARIAMPDQEAIQIVSGEIVALKEG